MSNQLEQILISATTPEWHQRLRDIHHAVKQAAYFDDGDENDVKLGGILQDVKKRGDNALVEYTKKFDKVTLKAEDFQVSADELKKAHEKIDKELLESIRGAIANVRKYQQEILIDVKNSSTGNVRGPAHRIPPVVREKGIHE